MPDRKRLFLVDGMSNIFRSYYAIRGLSNSKGLPTNAIYGFTTTLRKLIKDHKPDYLGVVLDSKERTIRQEQYADYKKHRPDMPEDLQAQIPYIERVCEALRIPVIKLARYEADDIMGTLARQGCVEGLMVIIVTNDKDLAQLVKDPDISILRVDKTGEVTLDAAGVKIKYGVNPEQIVDWLGLMGDAVDGIPGAPGIGEKGACQLLEEFGSIEAALTDWEKVKRKTYRESLRDHADQIRVSRELARIDLNVAVQLDLDALILKDPDATLAYQLFSELEFGPLTREFASGAIPTEGAGAAASERAAAEYRIITGTEDLRKLVDSLFNRDRFAFTLTEGASGQLTGIAFSSAPGSADIFDLENCKDREGAVKLLKEIFENGLIDKSTYDLKRAHHLLGGLGIIPEQVTDDALLQAFLLDSERSKYEIPALAREYLSISLNNEASAAQSADLIGKLADVMSARIEKDEIAYDFQKATIDFIYRQIEMPLIPILYQMEREGFRVDPAGFADLSVEFEKEIGNLSQKIYKLAGREFNISSTTQLGEIFEELNFEVSRRTTTGKIATSHAVLEELAAKYELPRLVIEHRELSKLKNTYVDTLPSLIDPKDGRIHTTLNQTGAVTGRISSINPNLQNIPIKTELGRRIRRTFIPADGHLIITADYSQIELRLLAHITKDPVMLETFCRGDDIHSRTAREVFGAKTEEELVYRRRQAKIVNFGIAYVIGPSGLAQRTGISRSEAKKVIADYYRTYAGVKKFMDEFPDRVLENNCVARSIFGRMRRLPDLKSTGQARAKAEREAINMPMQGSASDIIKLAMLRVNDALRRAKLKTRMILQVHDELVFEAPRKEAKLAAEIVKHAMEDAAKIDLPLVVEVGVGENWIDLE
jgi:DNA polymerase I